jgi:hypothetical protein
MGIKVKFRGKEGGAPRDIGAQARGGNLGCDRVTEHIHIGDNAGAGRDHLGQTKGGPGAHGPFVQLVLGGENIMGQPGLKVTSAPVAPQQGHGHMGVGVDQAGHKHLPAAVNFFPERAGGARRAHRGNFMPSTAT